MVIDEPAERPGTSAFVARRSSPSMLISTPVGPPGSRAANFMTDVSAR
jgi:hypothetical protein